MSTPIDIDDTIDPGGTVTQTAPVGTGAGTLQVENSADGASTDVDFHLQVRSDDSVPWRDWIRPYEAVANGDGQIDPVDLSNISKIRGKVVNNDGSNTADVRLIVNTL